MVASEEDFDPKGEGRGVLSLITSGPQAGKEKERFSYIRTLNEYEAECHLELQRV